MYQFCLLFSDTYTPADFPNPSQKDLEGKGNIGHRQKRVASHDFKWSKVGNVVRIPYSFYNDTDSRSKFRLQKTFVEIFS